MVAGHEVVLEGIDEEEIVLGALLAQVQLGGEELEDGEDGVELDFGRDGEGGFLQMEVRAGRDADVWFGDLEE